MSEPYTPFKRPFDKIETADLSVLSSVHEGWYVEYKNQIPSAQAIAKSVAAFANTYGGFLFFGIAEKSKAENFAGQFNGIDNRDLPGEMEKIRQAIAAYCSPEPHFEVKVFSGPCEEIGLAAEKSIICLRTPWSVRAPHIHKNGVIYRRVADSSEPIVENDRHRLSELFGRSEKLLEMYKTWYECDPQFTIAEKNNPYLRILLTADPWNEKQPWLGLSISEIRQCFNPADCRPTLPFSSIQQTRSGVLARQTEGNGLCNLTLTWALNRDLTSEIIIPVPRIKFTKDLGANELLAGYTHGAQFETLLEDCQFEELDVLDLNQLYLIFNGIFETLERISEASGWIDGYDGTFKMLNAQRSTPFVDIEAVIQRCGRTGIPIIFPFMSTLRTSISSEYLHSFC